MDEVDCLTCGAEAFPVDHFISGGRHIILYQCLNGHDQEMEAPPDEQG